MIRRTPEADDNARMLYLHVHIGRDPSACLYVAERHENTVRHGDFFLTDTILCATAFKNGSDEALEAIDYLQKRVNQLGGLSIYPTPVYSFDHLNEYQRRLLNL